MHRPSLPDEQRSWFCNINPRSDSESVVDVRVQRAKVALDAAHLLFEDAVPEARFELSLSQRCHGDAHRLLTATQKNVRQIRRQCSAIERRLCRERLEYREGLGVVYTRRLVFTTRDEIGTVSGELKICDDVHVRALVREHLIARVCV